MDIRQSQMHEIDFVVYFPPQIKDQDSLDCLLLNTSRINTFCSTFALSVQPYTVITTY